MVRLDSNWGEFHERKMRQRGPRSPDRLPASWNHQALAETAVVPGPGSSSEDELGAYLERKRSAAFSGRNLVYRAQCSSRARVAHSGDPRKRATYKAQLYSPTRSTIPSGPVVNCGGGLRLRGFIRAVCHVEEIRL